MATLKFTLILCVAVLYTCAQVPELQPADAASDHQLRDPASEVKKLLEKLEALINNTITEALSTFGTLMNQLNQTVIAFEEEAAKAFEATVEPFLETIEELKKTAAAAAVDISECVGDSEEVISSLPMEFLKNVTTCANDKLTQAKTYVDQTITDCTSVLGVISELGNQIDMCSKKHLIEQVVCFTAVTANITSYLVTLPLKITSDVEKTKIYFAAAIPAIALCDSGVVTEIGLEGAAIVANVTKCAFEKMNGTSTTVTPTTGASTKAPSSTTKVPLSTTTSLSTTKAPLSTTEVPLSTTKAPLSTTELLTKALSNEAPYKTNDKSQDKYIIINIILE